ncbi:MAG: hypothetical protein A2252_06550 [Elusimicrobia bacterium RIFOXYA2_FULL_39_19]|nr:MAG: hypothetical protein A2252_06550 [Elusimicrobia bacterium RIFOXYA2_FULL_39_19]
MEKDLFLVEKAKQGDKQAFKELVLLHQKRLYNLAYYFTKNEHDASDLYQETWVKIFEHLNKFKNNQNFPAWTSQILRNTFIDKYSRNKSKKNELSLNDAINIPLKTTGALAHSEKIEDELSVDNAITSLPVEFRETVVLVDLLGFTYEETAEITRTPVGTVRSRLNRARERLKVLFENPADF